MNFADSIITDDEAFELARWAPPIAADELRAIPGLHTEHTEFTGLVATEPTSDRTWDLGSQLYKAAVDYGNGISDCPEPERSARLAIYTEDIRDAQSVLGLGTGELRPTRHHRMFLRKLTEFHRTRPGRWAQLAVVREFPVDEQAAWAHLAPTFTGTIDELDLVAGQLAA